MSRWPAQRLTAPDPDTYDARQQEIHDAIASGPRGGVRGPLAVWLHRPELAAKAQELGRYCRYDTVLDPRLSELAILVTGRVFGSEYEWQIHKDHALKAGLASETIEAIRQNRRPVFSDAAEEAVHDISRAAHEKRHVDDDLYARAREVLGEAALVDLIGLLGYYTLISLTINVFRVPPMGDNPVPELNDE
ncbi:carboxymuconolactone decarboxylase family protein [Notoacmeibacter sp. MSK16QG-6]|uniref:carboxymuconolactone decarboxylase family protein n=1 Tax=Notoacmeibacter sp. MSK16QG-6 TaxID=2957982 RepID=UPI00209D4D9D|nr:carboxymuconolactone decarboxylase family protein [Notoacmeibacter sp. MSK16QG-6]MCP1200580.1 carboxymuconolactone decarboxylase family protein [Notoacmeibacter sp. MSK16QG-6]